ncbi:MAG: rRNA maturation RNase YbeY [Flavobacteriales bacterium]|nr:rRNA maturation RNase YbeY [Flavobacteriales bacterium]|tara:strand:+ start:1223 stop:1630 length:408 start_codon:yes stop_codon:yes gene_type:complete
MIKYLYNTDFKLKNEKTISSWIINVIDEETKELGEINFYFCDDNELLESNTKYLNHEEYTDILTFDYSEKKLVSADIMISVDRIQENSSIFDQKFEDELHRVIIHGILHIIGYNDKTEEEKKLMRKKEDYYIKKV